MKMHVTVCAQFKILNILAQENNPASKLRVSVHGGGCSGFSYGFNTDSEQNEDDFEIKAGNISILVDFISAQYLSGSTIDYIEDLQGSRFDIINPRAVTRCGCGSSFSPY